MDNFNYEMILVSEPTYSVISENEPFDLNSLRYENIYAYMANIDNFIDTRETATTLIPLNRLDRTGIRNSVLMGSTSGLRWQEISSKVVGIDRATIGFDESFIYKGTTLVASNFNWIEGVYITLSSVIPGDTGGRITSKIMNQGSTENNWQYVTPVVEFKGTAFTKLDEVVNGDGTSDLTFISKKDNLNVVGEHLLGTNGKYVKVNSLIDKSAQVKSGTVTKVVAATTYSISAINEDGSILNWGQISATDVLPPVNVKNFKEVSGDYYTFAGLTEDGLIYCWGYGGYTSKKIIDTTPTGSGFRQVSVGYDYAIAINSTYDLIHWGATARVDPALFPPRYTSVTEGLTDRSADDFVKVACGYQVAIALRRDGRIEAFAVKDYNNIILNAPKDSGYKDLDTNYQNALAIKADGTVVQWGYITYALPNFKGENIVKVIAGRYVLQAISSANNLFTWGTTTITNVIGTYKTGIVDCDTYNYHGAYIGTDYSIRAFVKSGATGSPYTEIISYAPASTAKAKQSGSYIDGYIFKLKLSEPILSDSFYPVTSRASYHTYSTDIRDETVFTPFVVDTVSLTSTDNIKIKYKRTQINTMRITFLYGVKTPYEIATNLQFDMESLRIGE